MKTNNINASSSWKTSRFILCNIHQKNKKSNNWCWPSTV